MFGTRKRDGSWLSAWRSPHSPLWTRDGSSTLAPLKLRALFVALLLLTCLPHVARAQAPATAADSSSLDFKQWGLLAIQDAGRRKPVDTFAREALIKITGRSSYKAQNGRKWKANDFLLSALLETHDWKSEPMVLVSLGELIERLGLDKTKRRFSFAELSGSPELQRMTAEAQELRRAEKDLNRMQQEVLNVSGRLALLTRIMDGSAFLIVPSPHKTTDFWVVPPAMWITTATNNSRRSRHSCRTSPAPT
jgi:hypothetical protein